MSGNICDVCICMLGTHREDVLFACGILCNLTDIHVFMQYIVEIIALDNAGAPPAPSISWLKLQKCAPG